MDKKRKVVLGNGFKQHTNIRSMILHYTVPTASRLTINKKKLKFIDRVFGRRIFCPRGRK
jgi:hypothetical protein